MNRFDSFYDIQRPPNSTSYISANGFVELDERDFCYIDEETAKTLELVQNNVDSANRKHSLLGYLNANTSTTTGTRLLREAILKPLCNHEVLEHRLDCIQYLTGRVDTLAAITNCIKKFGQGIDLDALTSCLINLFKTRNQTLYSAEKKLDILTTLETLVTQVTPLVAALDLADEPTLNVYKVALQDPAFNEIISEISSMIESDVKTNRGKRSKMFKIKQNVEPLFDIARSTYTAAVSDLEQYVRELQKEDGLPWKLNYSETRGFFLSLTSSQLPKGHVLSPRYIRVNKNRTVVSCTTRDLMQSNVRANVSYENSMKLANEVLTNCLASIMNYLSSLQRLVDVIGLLDLVTSFAKLVNNNNGRYCRPKFTSTDTVLIGSRHPVLESVLSVNDTLITPNDVMLSTGSQNFILVTGPNMGGKSIFLKQVGIIQILAQLGCYVPAESAVVRIMHRIVARSGSSEDNLSSCSSFMWEMRGIASALKRDTSIDNDSVMYLIDEVGRGTSIDDGASYSFAIAEELALRKFCFTVFATHFDQVFTLGKLYGNVGPYHFRYEEEDDGDDSEINSDCDSTKPINISHRLVPGLSEKSHYGIKLAQSCGLPDEILRIAKADIGLSI